MTNDEARVIQAEISRLNDGELALRRAVRERQRILGNHAPEIMEIVEKDITILDQEAMQRGLSVQESYRSLSRNAGWLFFYCGIDFFLKQKAKLTA